MFTASLDEIWKYRFFYVRTHIGNLNTGDHLGDLRATDFPIVIWSDPKVSMVWSSQRSSLSTVVSYLGCCPGASAMSHDEWKPYLSQQHLHVGIAQVRTKLISHCPQPLADQTSKLAMETSSLCFCGGPRGQRVSLPRPELLPLVAGHISYCYFLGRLLWTARVCISTESLSSNKKIESKGDSTQYTFNIYLWLRTLLS